MKTLYVPAVGIYLMMNKYCTICGKDLKGFRHAGWLLGYLCETHYNIISNTVPWKKRKSK